MASPVVFDASRARVERAEMHRRQFNDVWDAFVTSRPYRSVISVDDDGTGILRLEPIEPLPALLAVELREIVAPAVGSYQFTCTLHPGMGGTLKVVAR